MTIHQGKNPPGHKNGEEQIQIQPQTDNKEVIPPPPTGDEDIYTEAQHPEAGHEEEVIPPPTSSDANPSIETR